jgi:hypothetical protein
VNERERERDREELVVTEIPNPPLVEKEAPVYYT